MLENRSLSVDEYIENFDPKVQVILNKIRSIVFEIEPSCSESMSYGMPAYKYNKKPLIYFAAFNHHIGLYATPSAHEAFKAALSNYKQGKGSVQFPLDKPIPYELISAIISFKRDEINKK